MRTSPDGESISPTKSRSVLNSFIHEYSTSPVESEFQLHLKVKSFECNIYCYVVCRGQFFLQSQKLEIRANLVS